MLLAATHSPGLAADIIFTPLAMPQGDTESRAGMWFCPDLGKAPDILPLKTRVWATKESVTGGVAMKCVFEKGSRGILAYEKDAFPAGSAGMISLFAKASRKLTLKLGNVPAPCWKWMPRTRLPSSTSLVASPFALNMPTGLTLHRFPLSASR